MSDDTTVSDANSIEHCYVHVPFCPTICPFCSFEVLERRAGTVDAYLDRLDVECAATAATHDVAPLRTLYFGGGTPSYLRSDEFARLVAIIRGRFGWAPEVTLEVHPATASRDRFAAWADLGVTRFSVGVQSFDDDVLVRLGRNHDAAAGERCVEWAQETGQQVSLDLIVAVDGQQVAADLARAVHTGVDHVSTYTLTIEPGTPFARDGVEVDATAEHDAIVAAGEVLGAAGLARYEVSNHARPGSECRHNQAYWDGASWLGVGPGASAHLPRRDAPGAVRRVNAPFDSWLAGSPGETDELDPTDVAHELVVAGLRRVEGVDLDEVTARTGIVDPRWDEVVDLLVASGSLTRSAGRIAATPAGLLHLDAVTAAFL